MNPLVILKKSKDWASFKKQLARLDNKGKGDCFEALTQYYLKLHPTYATMLKHVWNPKKGEVPAAVHRKLNLPYTDEGIDLLVQTQEGDYWSVQCKYETDESKSLPKGKLDSFTDLSFNICEGISLGLVCTSVDRFSYKLKLYHADRLSFCSGENWRALDKEFFARIHADIAGRAKKIKPLDPYEHQKRAIRNAHKHFIKEKNNRGKMIMPCGSGKSLTSFWVAEKFKPKRVVVAVPSLSLIRQTLEVWARESLAKKRDIRWICVCSDKSVGDVSKDDIAVLTQDLGVEVKPTPSQITKWLRKRSTATSVVFVTYHSGDVLAKAARKAKARFDLGIFDEAHKTAGEPGKPFGHLLFDKNIKIAKRLFMTATERRYQGESDEILSMDNPTVYGNTFERLSFKEALACKPPILSDYQIVTMVVTSDEVKQLVRSNVLVKPRLGRWNKETEAKMLAAALQLRKSMQAHPLKHCISFHSSIARAEAFQLTQDNITRKFPEFGELTTFHVSGTMPTSARQRHIDEAITMPRSLITNARCLTEGVDVKQIDGILFADPKQSTVDIVQAVGRALRPDKGKERGYIIIPVVLDSKKLERRIEQNEAYADILMVLRALASNDDTIIEYFRSVSQGKRPKGGKPKFVFSVPEGIDIDPNEFAKQVELQVWSKLAKLSWMPFEEARAFVRKLKLKGDAEWRKYCKGELTDKTKKPDDIPQAAGIIYKGMGWKGFGDWLGTGTIAPRDRIYRSFEEAREFVRKLNLENQKEWRRYCKGELTDKPEKPKDIPQDPKTLYKDKGWKGLGDWLGTGSTAPRYKTYRSFEKARAFVHKLKLKNRAEWSRYCKGGLKGKLKKPDDISATPEKTYKDKGWKSVGDWLGTGTIAYRFRTYRPFEKARAFVHKLNLNNYEEWRKYCRGELKGKLKRSDDIPKTPYLAYKDKGWKDIGDWLGTGTVATRDKTYRSFEEARDFVRKLKLKNQAEWRRFCKGELKDKPEQPVDIPSAPNLAYKDKGWTGLGDWLGTGTKATRDKTYRSFEEARDFVRKLKLKHRDEWRTYCRGELKDKTEKPDDIPATPERSYKDKGWKGMPDFLGTAKKK